MDSVTFTIIGALITVGSAILNWSSSRSVSDKKSRRWYQHLVLLGAAFTAYGSWRAFLLSEERSWQQADIQFRDEWLQRTQLNERLRFEKQLRAKAEEIAALNRTIAASVTGGDSFCYLSVVSTSTREQLSFVVVSEGKFPLYEVQARVVDLDAKFPTNLNELVREQLLSIGNIAPKSATANPKWIIKTKRVQR